MNFMSLVNKYWLFHWYLYYVLNFWRKTSCVFAIYFITHHLIWVAESYPNVRQRTYLSYKLNMLPKYPIIIASLILRPFDIFISEYDRFSLIYVFYNITSCRSLWNILLIYIWKSQKHPSNNKTYMCTENANHSSIDSIFYCGSTNPILTCVLTKRSYVVWRTVIKHPKLHGMIFIHIDHVCNRTLILQYT